MAECSCPNTKPTYEFDRLKQFSGDEDLQTYKYIYAETGDLRFVRVPKDLLSSQLLDPEKDDEGNDVYNFYGEEHLKDTDEVDENGNPIKVDLSLRLVNGRVVRRAIDETIDTLDVAAESLSCKPDSTVKSISENNGIVNAEYQKISIKREQVNDLGLTDVYSPTDHNPVTGITIQNAINQGKVTITTGTSLNNLDGSSRIYYIKASSSSSLPSSFSKLNPGQSVTIVLENVSNNTITFPIPSTGNYALLNIEDTLELPKGRVSEISILCYTKNKYTIIFKEIYE